jgi:hypothetical protein
LRTILDTPHSHLTWLYSPIQDTTVKRLYTCPGEVENFFGIAFSV